MSALGSKNSHDCHLLRINPKSQQQCTQPCMSFPHPLPLISWPSSSLSIGSSPTVFPDVPWLYQAYSCLRSFALFLSACSTPHRWPQGFMSSDFCPNTSFSATYSLTTLCQQQPSVHGTFCALNLLYFFSKHLSSSNIFYIQYSVFSIFYISYFLYILYSYLFTVHLIHLS